MSEDKNDKSGTRLEGGAKIVELRFFGGYTDKETAQILGKNLAKVRRDWEFARSWLYDRLDATKD